MKKGQGMNLRLSLAIVAISLGWVTARGNEGYFDSAGVRIRYVDMGNPKGPPVLLVHGYMATADLNWRIPGVMRVLTDDYRVIALDNRGHGKSDKPTDVGDYGPKMAEDSVRLLDHLKIPKAHVVGYSMGGMITLYLAAHHPDRMLSAGVTGMGWIVKPTATETKPTQIPRSPVPALKSCIRSFPMLGLTRKELTDIQVPMRVIIGSADELYERRVKPLSEVRPDVQVVVIEGANHVNCFFRKEFKEALKAFLDEQPKTTRF